MNTDTPTTQETPRLIETVYEYNGIKVGVRIDFRQKRISLTENDGQGSKKWVFAEREVGYMAGWRNILDAMRYAIDTAEAVLREYIQKEQEEHAKQTERAMLLAGVDIRLP